MPPEPITSSTTNSKIRSLRSAASLRTAYTPRSKLPWQFVLLYTAPAQAKTDGVEDVAAAVLDGAVRVGRDAGLPLHHYPLERTAQAHRC